jgi:hypothetical protein
MITIDQLKAARWQVLYFADGKDPKHIQAYACREFSRFTRTSTKPKVGDWRIVYAVDGVEIERGEDVDAWLQKVADALNKENPT